ncbi:MAG: hypothetical protein E7561_02275 [Ruminococcaceae bacterium]|nr:hypothetical protein [Oscillospiraceae bacterium]
MDNRYYDNVIGEMQSFLDENNFKCLDDGSFKSQDKQVKVEYDEARQMYLLKIAGIEDGVVSEYNEVSAWLFDDSQNAKDAASVGVDFAATLRENLGIKIKRAVSTDIELPSANKSGSLTMAGFTKKLLDIFPAFKDSYKEHVAHYGQYLYLDFLGEYFVPQLKNVFTVNDKKQVKKLVEFLGDSFNKGDRETVNAVLAVTVAAIYNDDAIKQNFFMATENEKYYLEAVKNFIPVFPKNKKLVSLLVK